MIRKHMAALAATAVAASGLVSLTASPAEAAGCQQGRVIETVTVRLTPNTGAPSVGTRTRGSIVCIYDDLTGTTYTACGSHSSQWLRISTTFEVPPKYVIGTCVHYL